MKIRLSELRKLIKQTIKEATVLDLSARPQRTSLPQLSNPTSCECLECGEQFSCENDPSSWPSCPDCGAVGDSIVIDDLTVPEDDTEATSLLSMDDEDELDDLSFERGTLDLEDDYDTMDPTQFPKSTSGRRNYHR